MPVAYKKNDRDKQPATQKQQVYIESLLGNRLVPTWLKDAIPPYAELTHGDCRRFIAELERCPHQVTFETPTQWVTTGSTTSSNTFTTATIPINSHYTWDSSDHQWRLETD